MPWYSSLSEALRDRGVPSTAPQPRERWAGAVAVDDGDEEARALVEFLRSPRYAAAAQELTRWHRLALRDANGTVVGEVDNSTDLGHLLRSRPDLSAWIPCGPETGLLGFALTDAAALVEFSKDPAPPKSRDDVDKGRHTKSPMEARASAIEIVPEQSRIRARLRVPGEAQTLSEIGAEFLRPRQQASMYWYCWRWPSPDGWQFRTASAGVGLKLAHYVPAEGSVISHDGRRFAVSWSYTGYGKQMYDCPPWLLQRLGKWVGRRGRG